VLHFALLYLLFSIIMCETLRKYVAEVTKPKDFGDRLMVWMFTLVAWPFIVAVMLKCIFSCEEE
jgi:hypothetical protein